MDAVDFWASKVHSTKHFSPAHFNTSRNHNESEGEEEARSYFPCPFCYVEIEIQVFCAHLQEEHCFDLRNAICPLCAGNLGKDVIGHFTMQHAQSVKRRRKSQKSGFWTSYSSSAVVGKDDLSSFLFSNSSKNRVPAPDPLLSPFLCNLSPSKSTSNQHDEYSSNAATPTTSDVKSTKPSLLGDNTQQEKEEDYEEKRQRAIFSQQLIMSTIF